MVFVGFGFLMAYLRHHCWSSIGFTLLIGCFSIQFGIIAVHFWEHVVDGEWADLSLNMISLIRGDFVAATVLISYGGVIGKFNLSQYLVMAFFEIIFITLN